jgi:hypothetical protein
MATDAWKPKPSLATERTIFTVPPSSLAREENWENALSDPACPQGTFSISFTFLKPFSPL